MVCSYCGSANVQHDAWASWDTESQVWEIGDVYDNADCNVCCGERSIDAVPLADWKASLTQEHELEGFTYRAFKHHDGLIAALIGEETEPGVNSVVAHITGDTLGSPFFSLEEALDEARRRIMSGVIRRPEWPVPASKAVTHG